VRVGMEACGQYPWFERLLGGGVGTSCGSEDASQIRASVVRRQKTDRRDAEQLLQLLREERLMLTRNQAKNSHEHWPVRRIHNPLRAASTARSSASALLRHS